MIEDHAPASWRELQEWVARILRESGVVTAVERLVQTARGEVSIDVWAHDASATPAQTYLIECKKWRKRVPQTVVHAFRTVVGDSGANWGAIICAAGFQTGAYAAAQYSNVRLLTWAEFQSLFVERWFSDYFLPVVAEATDPLVEYTEQLNSRIFRKADLLPEDRRQEFRRLREVHWALGSLCMLIRVESIGGLRMMLGRDAPSHVPDLPLRSVLGPYMEANGRSFPDTILDARSYRSLLQCLVREAEAAIAQFDEVFGERA